MVEYSVSMLRGIWTVCIWVNDIAHQHIFCESREDAEQLAQALSSKSPLFAVLTSIGYGILKFKSAYKRRANAVKHGVAKLLHGQPYRILSCDQSHISPVYTKALPSCV